jgi:hypothetical protein
LFRVRALRNFKSVTGGEVDGYVKSENNFSPEGAAWAGGARWVVRAWAGGNPSKALGDVY